MSTNAGSVRHIALKTQNSKAALSVSQNVRYPFASGDDLFASDISVSLGRVHFVKHDIVDCDAPNVIRQPIILLVYKVTHVRLLDLLNTHHWS